MLAALGTHRFDVTHDAVLLATTTAAERRAPDAVVTGWTGAPDAVLVLADDDPAPAVATAVRAWCAAVDVPVVVRTPSASAAAAALSAGAVAAHDPSGLADPDYLDTVASAGASIVIGCPPAPPLDGSARAEQLLELAEVARCAVAGPGMVAVDVTRGAVTAPADVRFLDELHRVAAAGWPVLVVVAPTDTDPEGHLAVAAAHAVALSRGARLLPTTDVRTTRRVARVAAELLRARDSAGTGP